MGLTGETKQLSGVSPDIAGLREGVAAFLQQGGFGANLFPSVVPDAASMQPFLDLFTQQNRRVLGQAKESAGNLTGSGFANILGRRSAEAQTSQGAFLSQLFEQRRQQDADRFLQLLLGFGTSGVGPPQNVYQPGFLDSLTAGAAAIAPGLPFLRRGGGGTQPTGGSTGTSPSAPGGGGGR
jgi:hypothetical protein